MKVLVLGGDGYLGWPVALHLSSAGHEVEIVDSGIRRAFDREMGYDSLNPISTLDERVAKWEQVSGAHIRAHPVDITDYAALSAVFEAMLPDAVVHFAEQRSAPYSMIDRQHAVFTQTNNLVGTLNLLYCLAEHRPECHLIKLGTMGEYGTPGIDIEEGFIEIHHKGRSDVLPFPKQANSFYHLSKVHDSHNIEFVCRTWKLRATDLHQGVVYGFHTGDTDRASKLETRFDYDQVFGTALNRFCVQAALGLPLSVYGKGGQTRGYINIRDTLACIELTLNNPAEVGRYRVFNQFTEQFNLNDIATRVVSAAAEMGLQARIDHVDNPRTESESHHFNAAHSKLQTLGLEPHLLDAPTIQGLIALATRHADRVDPAALNPTVNWRRTRSVLSPEDKVAEQSSVAAPWLESVKVR
ncbi:MAG TPA: NAD-dependent epimerase/dehydratase family protein [Chloroflexota bacterium]|nr:NAD-dependent epimerase/dehydratase family protein [Chloroflexota bacterium]